MARRVVVTGVGALSSVGNTAERSWQAVLGGKSGVDRLTHFDTGNFLVKVAAELKSWNPLDNFPAKEVRRRDRYQLIGQAATLAAFRHSGLTITDANRHRSGVVIGSSIGGMTSFSDAVETTLHDTPRRVSPFGVPSFMTTTASSMAAIELGLTGASYTITSACATGADCIGHAFDQIRLGRLDQALAGAAEAPILPTAVAAFDRLGACSHVTSRDASRPFDRTRTGMVIGEAAAVLVLESLEHAMARGATILAEVVGYGATSDAYHMVAPHQDGKGATAAIQMAMQDAKIQPEDLDYISAHGTATLLNDPMETLAVKHALGEQAYNVPMSSTKSMTGHCMGATAALEAVFSVLSLRDQVIPPTMHLDQPDDTCDLDYVPREARVLPLKYVMSNAFGFGGHNASLVFKVFGGS